MATVRKTSKPICWDCGIDLPVDNGYRREAPEVVALPSGVIVCTPACPGRPDGLRTWKRGEENFSVAGASGAGALGDEGAVS